jgi:hypothetical protein
MHMRDLFLSLVIGLVGLCGCQSPSGTATANATSRSVVDLDGQGTLPPLAPAPEERSTKSADSEPGNRASGSSRDGDKEQATVEDRAGANRANRQVVAGQQRAQRPIGPAIPQNGLAQDRAGGDANVLPEGARVLDTPALDGDSDLEMGPPMETTDDYYTSLEDRVRVRLASDEENLTTTSRAGLDSELQSMGRRVSPGDLPRERADLPAEAEYPDPRPQDNPFLKGINGKCFPGIDWAKWQRVRACARDSELGGFAPRP